MRIAMLSELGSATPPSGYGGTERVVSALTEELVKSGHEVTLFATADSLTSARLISCAPHGTEMRSFDHFEDRYEVAQLGEFIRRADEFDVVHSHIDYRAFPLAAFSRIPFITTVHRPVDLPEKQAIYDAFPQVPIVAVSNNQRSHYARGNWIDVIYNGLSLEKMPFRCEKEDYLAFVGHICEEKGVLEAINIGRLTGMKLKIAARIKPRHQAYFDKIVRPQLELGAVEFVGELDDKRKLEFLSRARALVLPARWPEPFGLVLIEAMACGTPVLATRCGSIPEIVADGITGLLGDTALELAEAAQHIRALDPRACRSRVIARFGAKRMYKNYEDLYLKLLH